LEAIEGIGPKTVEKISLAVNNYFASLEPGAPVEGEVPMEGEAAAEASDAGAEDVPAEAAASAEVAPSEEGTVEADTLASDEHEGQAKDSEEQGAPEAESAPETRE